MAGDTTSPRKRRSFVPGARHGTLTGYTKDLCGCDRCRAAGTRAHKLHSIGLKLRVDATPIKRHLLVLHRTMSFRGIAEASSVDYKSVWEIAHGRRQTVLRATAEKLRAVTPTNGRMGVSSVGSQRRVHALNAMGWTGEEIGRRVGERRGHAWANITRVTQSKQVTAMLAHEISVVYEEMAKQTPPPGPANRRAKARAQRHKWAPPPAWDSADIDDPAARPDWEAVLCGYVECGRPVKPGRGHCRQCGTWLQNHGTLDDYSPARNTAALVENARFVSRAEGWPLNEEAGRTLIAERLGVTPAALIRALERHAKQDKETQAEPLAVGAVM
ncbi:hypothetical protein ACQPYK_25290 [Streptosporangium sp. CA-135522]|uniref:hypothetical protein n=1 Tax=Streptosporangium sp. CA-135522 TaxID=3240072 RepID=UPI003D90A0E4